MSKTKNKMLKEKLFYVVAICLSIFALFFFVTGTWIGYETKDQCKAAQDQYGGDCIEALISLLGDENQGYRARNSAIWPLGQLGDKRALPILQSYYTGEIPDREPLDSTVSQYELKKAINLTSGGVNISSVLWREFLNQ